MAEMKDGYYYFGQTFESLDSENCRNFTSIYKKLRAILLREGNTGRKALLTISLRSACKRNGTWPKKSSDIGNISIIYSMTHEEIYWCPRDITVSNIILRYMHVLIIIVLIDKRRFLVLLSFPQYIPETKSLQYLLCWFLGQFIQ